MIDVTKDQFNQILKTMRFVKVELNMDRELQGDSKFFAVEVGDDVIVIQNWNNDFCTASFKIPNAFIVKCNVDGNDKYTVGVRVAKTVSLEEEEVPSVFDMSSDNDESDASAEQRFDSIEASGYYDVPPTSSVDEPIKTPITKKPVPQSNGERPIVTMGRQKPEETVKAPAPQKVVNTPKDPKPQQRKHYEEPAAPVAPVADFGDW